MNSIKKMAAAMVLAVSLFTSQSQAFLILDLAVNGDHPRHIHYPILAIAVCVFFLPACILEESTDPSASVNQLLANGYNLQEAKATVAGQSALITHLKARNQVIRPEGPMSKSDLLNHISQVKGVTPAYLQYLSDNL